MESLRYSPGKKEYKTANDAGLGYNNLHSYEQTKQPRSTYNANNNNTNVSIVNNNPVTNIDSNSLNNSFYNHRTHSNHQNINLNSRQNDHNRQESRSTSKGFYRKSYQPASNDEMSGLNLSSSSNIIKVNALNSNMAKTMNRKVDSATRRIMDGHEGSNFIVDSGNFIRNDKPRQISINAFGNDQSPEMKSVLVERSGLHNIKPIAGTESHHSLHANNSGYFPQPSLRLSMGVTDENNRLSYPSHAGGSA